MNFGGQAINKSDLDITDREVDELLNDWKYFEEQFKPMDDFSIWRLKYFIALAFCKGWEAAKGVGKNQERSRPGAQRVLLEARD